MTDTITPTKPLVHEIHVSEIKEFKKCKAAHNFKYVEQFYPKKVAKQLEFGTAFHAGMETYFNPETWSFPPEIKGHLAELEFIRVCENQRDAALKEFGKFHLEVDQEADYKERLALGVGMIRHYFKNISPEIDSWFEPVFVEKNFSVAILDEAGNGMFCYCEKCIVKWMNEGYTAWTFKGLPVHLEGTIDLIVKDKRSGKIFILDWKTTANIPLNHEWLELEEQPLYYCVAVQLFMGVDVGGFVYHEQRKGYPQAPKRNVSRRLGRLFSVAKDQDTDVKHYMEAITAFDSEAFVNGLYDDFLAYLHNDGIKYHERTMIRKNNLQLAHAANDLWNVCKQIISEGPVYPSPGKFNCTYCEFMQVCIGKATLADYTYTLATQFERKEHYYEQRSTDK